MANLGPVERTGPVSLLDGTETVQVYANLSRHDADGNTVLVPSTVPTTMMVRVNPVAAVPLSADGQQVVATYRVTARPLVAQIAFSKVVWRGQEFAVVGAVTRSTQTDPTNHVQWLMRAVDGAVTP